MKNPATQWACFTTANFHPILIWVFRHLAKVSVIQSQNVVAVGMPAGCGFAWQDIGDSYLKSGLLFWCIVNRRLDFCRQCGSDFFVCVDVQYPLVAALFFRKSLLRAIPVPVAMQHTCSERCGDLHGRVCAARIHDDNFICPVNYRLNCLGDASCFVLRDDVNGNWLM